MGRNLTIGGSKKVETGDENTGCAEVNWIGYKGEISCNNSDEPLAPIHSKEFFDHVNNKSATKIGCNIRGLENQLDNVELCG
jgi:hypothetical protein